METADKPRTFPKPVDFDQLYPGRFLKAGELLGKKVSLTMTAIDLTELETEGGKKIKATVSFSETEKQLVLCKTNGICIKAMFGKAVQQWVGKRITIFPDKWNEEPCIRIWGSPDIKNDFEVDISLPRRRPFRKTMHTVRSRSDAHTDSPKNGLSPPTIEEATVRLRTSASHSLDEFLKEKKSIWAVYATANVEVPIDIEAIAHEIREDLESRS